MRVPAVRPILKRAPAPLPGGATRPSREAYIPDARKIFTAAVCVSSGRIRITACTSFRSREDRDSHTGSSLGLGGWGLGFGWCCMRGLGIGGRAGRHGPWPELSGINGRGQLLKSVKPPGPLTVDDCVASSRQAKALSSNGVLLRRQKLEDA